MPHTRAAPLPAPVELGAGRPHDTETPDIETASDRYATRRFRGAIGQWLLEQQASAIEQLLRTTDGKPLRVLEVGGGHGQVTPLLLRAGHTVVVQGSAPVCMARVAEPLRRHPDRASACVSRLWQLPFADGAFDLVIAVRLLGHVTAWQSLLAEMARVSRRYVMVEFARARQSSTPAFAKAIFALKHRVENTTRPFFAYREAMLVEELEAHGLRRCASVGQFALPMVVHRMLRSPQLSAALEHRLRAVGVGDDARSPVVMLAERVPVGGPEGGLGALGLGGEVRGDRPAGEASAV